MGTKLYIIIFGALFWLSSFQSIAQEEDSYDSLLNSYLESDSIFLSELETLMSDDSLSIIDLIDSLVFLDPNVSQLSFRVGYTSKILNAGRDLGIPQYGFNGSISYYHKSGLFGELSGFWNSELTPKYNPTITSLGYMNTLGKKLFYILSYEHYFYHESQEEEIYIPYNNSLGASAYLDFNYLLPGINYYYLFGNENVHRIQGYLSGRFRIKKFSFIDQVTILPTFSVLYGNQHLIYEQINYRLLYFALYQLRQGNVTRQQLREARDRFINQTEENVYGILNYNLSLPIYIYIGRSTIMVNYAYNIPKALPGELIEQDNNSYISLSYIYSIPLK